MKIEELRDALIETWPGLDAACRLPERAVREFALRAGIPLEEPEPTLEERHPRPWKMKRGSMYDANDERTLVGSHEDESWDALVAAFNREPLLLEIAEAARTAVCMWSHGEGLWRNINPALDKLESLLHRLRLEQREENS